MSDVLEFIGFLSVRIANQMGLPPHLMTSPRPSSVSDAIRMLGEFQHKHIKMRESFRKLMGAMMIAQIKRMKLMPKTKPKKIISRKQRLRKIRLERRRHLLSNP